MLNGDEIIPGDDCGDIYLLRKYRRFASESRWKDSINSFHSKNFQLHSNRLGLVHLYWIIKTQLETE